MSASEDQSQGPIIRDRRRIDPVTGQPKDTAARTASDAEAGQAPRAGGQARPGKHAVSKPGSSRTPAADAGESAEAAAAKPGAAGPGAGKQKPAEGDGAASKDADADLAVKLAERTADLQRVQAEYANYRKRVERDRAAVREHALASVLSDLLPVLDDIGRARDHGELNGGFKAVAESLEAATVKLGLSTFGKAGEEFDPNVHEALMHSYSADVTEPTCVQILQPGYRVGERILRPARVAVAEPTDPSGARTAGDGEAADDEKPAAAHAAGQADADKGAEAGDESGTAEASASDASGATEND